MHGNFLEWCLDYFGPYPTEHVTDPVGPGHGDGRVLRGGSFSSHPEYIRSAARYRYVTRVEFAFRIVMELNKK